MTRIFLFLFAGTFYLPVVQSQPVSSGPPHQLIQLQQRYNTLDTRLRTLASESLDEGFTDREFTQWLTLARQDEDEELRDLILSRERAYQDIQQVVSSMARSAAFSADREGPMAAGQSREDAGSGRVYSEAEQEALMQRLQKLTGLRRERAALLAEDEEVPGELAGNIQELEQQILDIMNRDLDSDLLIPDADGDTL